MDEVWRDIKDFEGLYEISNLGRVKSLPKWMGNYYSTEKVLKPKLDRYGYQKVTLCNGQNVRKYATIHRLVATAFIENTEGLNTVNHIDGDKLNNKVDNLEWMSNRENINHAWGMGLKEKARKKASEVHGYKCKLICIHTGEEIEFNSQSKLSLFLGYNSHWLSSAIRGDINYNKSILNKGYKIVLEV